MKPTWGIRKLNEYSVDKNTAIIITDSEKDNYYWADIPDGSLLVNDKTGNLSIKLTGESDWVPMGIRKDGTEKLVKDAVINVEYYTIVKFELEHNRFYYHDREEITRIGKIINGKAQFKVGSGLYLPGTNQLEVLINDSVHRNTIDGGLEEINMKYFQIDADDIRLGSTVTVRYINYERLSELYPFIYTQEQVPWFFEDKDLWINPSNNIDVNGLTITPLSYYVKYLDNNEAEVIVFTTKNSRLIASRKMNEYVNTITDKNVNRFKITRENNNFYINIFSTYPGYKTSFAKVLIKGLISDEDKLTLDVDLTYPNIGMAKISAKTQLGNIVTFKRNNKKIYSAQNIGIGIQHTLAREENNYEVVVSVKNPANGLIKEKTLTIKKKMINLTANVSHVTSVNGTTISVKTIPESKISVIPVYEFGVEGTPIIPETVVDANGRFSGTIPLTNSGAHYKVIVTNEKADNTIEENIEVLLHNPRTPLSVNIVDAYDSLDESLKGRKSISIQAESGSTIIIKDQSSNTVFTHTPSNLSVEEAQYNIPLFYTPETKTFTIEAIKTNKVPESKTVTVQGYEKVNAPIKFQVKDFEYESSSSTRPRNTINTRFIIEAGSTVTVYDSQNNIVNNSNSEQHSYYNNSINSFAQYNNPNYSFIERNSDQTFRFVCSHPLYKDQEVVKVLEGRHLPEYTIEVKDAFVINPYADMYNSSAYQVLALKVKHNKEDLSYESLIKDFTFEYNNKIVNSINDVIIDNNIFFGGKESYKYFYDTDDLSNIETLVPNNKLENYINNSYCINLPGETTLNLLVFKVDNFDDVLHDRTINIKVNGKAANDIIIPTTILHWKNFDNFDNYSSVSTDYQDTLNKINRIKEKYTQNFSNFNGRPLQKRFNNENFNYRLINNNIKYIHPNLLLQIVISIYGLSKYYSRVNEEKRKEIEKSIDNFISEVEFFIDFKLSKHIVDDKTEYLNYSYYGNKVLNNNNIPVLIFNHNLLLYPKLFAYFNIFYNVNSSNSFEEYYLTDNAIILDIKQENIDNIIINNKSNSETWKNKVKELFKKIYPNQSYIFNKKRYNISSENQVLFCKLKKIPSNFNSNINNWNHNNFIYTEDLDTIENKGLCHSYFSYIAFKYSRIFNIGDNAFRYPLQEGTIAFNLSQDNTFEFGNRKYNPFLGSDGYLSSIKNPSKEDLDIVNEICPLPYYLSDPFKIFLTSTKDIGISDIFFNESAVELVEFNCNSVTFVDENYNPIRYDKINDTCYLGLKNNYNLFFTKNNLDEEKTSSYNTGEGFLSHFYNTRKLKEIDLKHFTNYYIYNYDFMYSGVKKIIFPNIYLNVINNDRSFKNTAVYPFMYCDNLEKIENLDFILCATDTIPYSFFKDTIKLNNEINLNYIKVFYSQCFYNTSENISFVYKKRNVNIDHLGNIINLNDNYLDLLDSSNDYGIMLYDSIFYNSKIRQKELDKIINRFLNIPYDTFYNNKNISEINIDSNKIISIVLYGGKYNKINIISNSLEVLELYDTIFNIESMKTNNNNYIIKAPNLKYFYCQKYGYTADKDYFNIGNPKASFFAKKDNFKFFPISTEFNFVKPTSYFIEDFLEKSSGFYNSYFTQEESENVINNLELEIPTPNYISYLFDKTINLNDIKIKKLIITLNRNSDLNLSKYVYAPVYNGHQLYSFINSFITTKDVIEKIRWPALEEIIIKNDYNNTIELNVLGVKIKYVQA